MRDLALAAENAAAAGFGIGVETATGQKDGRLGDTDGFLVTAGMRAIGAIHLPPASCKVSVTQCDSESLGANRDTSSRLDPERASESLLRINASYSGRSLELPQRRFRAGTVCAGPRLLADSCRRTIEWRSFLARLRAFESPKRPRRLSTMSTSPGE